MSPASGDTGLPLTTFARPLVLDRNARTLTAPVLLWESISVRTGPAATTLSDVTPARPVPANPLAFEVRKAPGSLSPSPYVTLGRTLDNDLVIDDGSISRYHAQLQLDPQSGQWSLADTGSKNGTFARGERLKPLVWFSLGDEEPLVLGSASIRFLMPEAFYAYVDSLR